MIDVSDIEHPKSVAWYEPEYGGVHNVWAAGDRLYLGAYNGGFHAFDVSGELRGDLRAQGRTIAEMLPVDTNGRRPEQDDDVGRGGEERPRLRERHGHGPLGRAHRSEAGSSVGNWKQTDQGL